MRKAFRSLQNGTKLTSLFPEANYSPPSAVVINGFGTDLLWTKLLQETIVTEILPILVSAKNLEGEGGNARPGLASEANVAAFVDLIIADDMEEARAVADRVIVTGGGRDSLLHDLLTPAAQLLGKMWERDDCDFTTVTLGVYRLDQIMKETATVGFTNTALNHHDNRILLVPAPGEQHSFGLSMVADAFREGGWCVRSGPSVTRPKLLRLVRGEWFDVVGLSISSERAMKGLPACIRMIRQASRNPGVYIMVGGAAIVNHMERTRFLGADAAAIDAQHALMEANNFVETTVTASLHQSKTGLVDRG